MLNAEFRLLPTLATSISDIFSLWLAFRALVVVDVPHHVTQRGNARQVILASDNDKTGTDGTDPFFSIQHLTIPNPKLGVE